MANTLHELLILTLLVTLVCSITTDKKGEFDGKDPQGKDVEGKDDLETQETGWNYNPLQETAGKLEYLKNKIVYPFSALKSPATPYSSSGGYSPGNYYPTYSLSGSGNYYLPPKPKQYFNYYNPGSYKKSYASYPYKTWYNKNYYSTGGYQWNAAGYAPDCYYPSSGQSFQPSTPAPPTYSSVTPLNVYYSSVTPSQTYGVPGGNFGAKAAISATPTPISYSSHFQSSAIPQSPPNSYIWRITSSPQYSDDGSSSYIPSVPSLPSTPAPPYPGIPSSIYSPPTIPAAPSLPTIPSQFPSTPSPPSVVSTNYPTLPTIPNSFASGPISFPIPISSQGDDGVSQEVIITPPTPSLRGQFVTASPDTKVSLSDPSYAVSYYPNVFYASNEQRLEKTSSTQGNTPDISFSGISDDSSVTSTPSPDSLSTTTDSTPSTKSQTSAQTLPGPGLTTFYSSQTLDQTRIPVPFTPGQFFLPQSSGGFYPSAISNVFGGSGSGFSYVPLSSSSQGVPFTNVIPLPSGNQGVPLTNFISSYPVSLYRRSPIGYQTARTAKNC